MSEMGLIKSQILHELWLPMARKGGDFFVSRKKKNKEMKILTLTSNINYEEVSILIDENLALSKDIIAWNHDYLKIFRLETNLGDSIVLGSSRYENSIQNQNFSLDEHFPFNVINLDFSSQEPIFEDGRIEKEVISVEKTIKFQKRTETNFVMIYTTILDNSGLDLNKICDESSKIMLRGWPGLVIDEILLNDPIIDISKKIEGIECILNQISRKYNYSFESAGKTYLNCNDGTVVFSIAAILKRV